MLLMESNTGLAHEYIIGDGRTEKKIISNLPPRQIKMCLELVALSNSSLS